MSTMEREVCARWVDDALRQMVSGSLAVTGEAFFHALVAYLSRALGFNYCFIGTVEESKPNLINTVVSISEGVYDEPYSFDFRNTPCENVVGKALCYYPSGVDRLFPKDHWLTVTSIESYIGIPLCDSDQRALGVISGMSHSALASPETACALLEIFAPRVSAELQRVRSERALRFSEQRMRRLFEAVFEGVVIHQEGRVVEANPAMKELTGFSEEELIGQELAILFAPQEHATLHNHVAEGRESSLEVLGTTRNGASRHWEIIDREIDHDLDRAHIMAIRDITERKRQEAELQFRATHDLLTELPNRVLFIDRLQQAIADSFRTDRQFALHYIDLDGFKEVNDRYGHAKGDELLQRVSEVLKRSVRNTDTVSRLGGDEFAVIQRNLNGPDDARTFARKLITKLSALNGRHFCDCRVSASIGIVMFPDEECSLNHLLEKADTAMYAAKRGGTGNIRFYPPSSKEVLDAFIESHREREAKTQLN